MEVPAVDVLSSGMLRHDRRYAIVDDAGKVFNAKRSPLIHRIRAHFDVTMKRIEFSWDNAPAAKFHIDQQQGLIEEWLSDKLECSLRLIVDNQVGFPDDPDALGPTIVSDASLREVASWFDGLTPDELVRRMRCNIVVTADTPFWEDQFAAPKSGPIRIGDVSWQATGICGRCVVPTRDPTTGNETPLFQKRFATQRQMHLPATSPTEIFDHYYRFTINTKLDQRGEGNIQLGDPVSAG
ncbi:MAG: hypothetical protein ACI9G1_001153 [Pirellulaceae bacterium]